MKTDSLWISMVYLVLAFACGLSVGVIIVKASADSAVETSQYLAGNTPAAATYAPLHSGEFRLRGRRVRVVELQPAGAPGINCIVLRQISHPPVMDCYEVSYTD